MGVFSTAEEDKVCCFFSQCVLITIYMENMENSLILLLRNLMQWQSLGIPSEGKFHRAAAKMEVRFKHHVGKYGKFGFSLCQMILLE